MLLTYPGNRLATGRLNKCVPHMTFKAIDLRGYKQHPTDSLVYVFEFKRSCQYIPLCSALLPIRKTTLKNIYIEPSYIWSLITDSPQDYHHKYCICIKFPAELTLPSFQPSVKKQTYLEERGNKRHRERKQRTGSVLPFNFHFKLFQFLKIIFKLFKILFMVI